MSDPAWLSLDGDEEIHWQGQPRQRVVLQGVALGLIAALVVGALGWLVVGAAALSTAVSLAVVVPIALAAFAVPTAAAWLWRRTTRYVLTETALYHRTGVLSVTVTELSLRKIQNTSYAQGVLGNVFGHGTVTVDTAGSEGAELRLVAMNDPAAIQRRIAERAKRVRGDDADAADVPGTLEQWRAVLAEIRGVRAALDRE
ncbi:PH domain-containing protein [Halomicroarcula limicola]|uniref:PH domain-containing protein n=1 Tax=Haloarcula limicola TaxID=1429915 RepID=A0A8J8C629_9EURY|nr:PH domain-containing protein [Halomicroarcula limicola]MBV0923473.1 PH domain-containing protein [Halomicroarcula limicola]